MTTSSFRLVNFTIIKLFVALQLLLLSNRIHVVSSVETGSPHSEVQVLTTADFDDAVNDPANGLWLLKFYAPWCGHCKKLAPTLHAIAPYLAGKLAIGTIDCTASSAKSLCDTYKVKAYPTLKIIRDGYMFDYTAKRDPDSIIDFAEKMSAPAVKIVMNYEEALEKVVRDGADGGSGSGVPVGFIAYDGGASKARVKKPDEKEISEEDVKVIEDIVASTTALQVFGQIARANQAHASFGVLHATANAKELKKFGVDNKKGPLLIKVEEGEETIIYDGPLSSPEFMDFVKMNNVALLTDLGAQNFRRMGDKGKPLTIFVTDDSQNGEFENEVKKFARGGTNKDKYYFCRMDGIKWKAFLQQFALGDEGKVPSLFILDVKKRTFWANETISSVEEFMKEVEDGTIEGRQQDTGKKGFLKKMHNVIEQHRYLFVGGSFSLVIIVLAAVTLNSGYLTVKQQHQFQEIQRKKKRTLKED